MGKTSEPVYTCRVCGNGVSAQDTTCPSCGTSLLGNRLIKLEIGGQIRPSGSLSTAVYAPLGLVPSKEDLSYLEKAIKAMWAEMKKWKVEGANIGIPPFVIRMKRVGKGK